MPTSLYRITILLLLLILGLASLPASNAQETATVPYFEPASCMFEVPLNVREGEDVDCGYLTVPEEYDDPANGRTLRLAVAIINSTSDTPASDPLVLAQGGPGGSTIETYTQVFFLGLGFADQILATRDVILLEQRGTMYSEPSLMCDESYDATLQVIQQDLPEEEADMIFLAAVQACYDRLSAAGINLSAFDSVENAADVAALREALGFETYNFYGVSYGTSLGQHLLRDHPEGLRTVILDAILPLAVNPDPEIPLNAQSSFDLLFEACAADVACNTAYADLQTVFYEVVDNLKENPARFEIRDPETGEFHEMVMDDTAFLEVMFSLMYQSSVVPRMPRIIYDAQAGEFTLLAQLIPLIVLDRSMSVGMYYSVTCAEDSDFTAEDQLFEGVDPHLQEVFDATFLLQSCAIWQVEQLDDFVDEAVNSDIPVLLLSGEYDPATPVRWAESVAAGFPNSYAYVFPGESHGIFLIGSDCPNEIILAFLRDPADAPDASCIDTMTTTFQTPETAVINLQPFSNEELGFSGVVPEGWEELMPGMYAQSSLGDIALFYQAVPNPLGTMDVSTLGAALEADSDPVLLETFESNGLSWELYQLEAQGMVIDLAFATKDNMTYMVLFISFPAEAEAFYQRIFVPAVKAFAPLQ